MNNNKKKKNLFHLLGLVMIFVTNSMPLPVNAAAEADSAQQALQQLRLLQQRLSQSGGTQQPSAGTNKPNQANQQGKEANKSPLAAGNAPPAGGQQANSDVLSQEDNELIDVKAFEGVSRQLFPLSPEQIIRLKQMYQANEFAEASTAGTPPKPTATSQIVNLSPGSTPPVIRLSQGFVSSLVFLDSTGAPWPISAYDLGDPSSFNIQWDKTSNTLMIQALKLYNYGNLAVRLRGLNTPVMLTLIPGQKAVDYRVDLRIQGFGPNAKTMPTEEGLPPSANDVLLHVLDGVPPAGSQRLTVSGGDARAWIIGDKMYVRTNLTILSPGWIGSMTSADGMHAYEMQKSPVLLVSWHGKVMQLKVEGL
ncbi:DotH/IcmK family type IV secretion protein [Legionella micdadei]|uniref:Component of the Dot/Icm secretion system n=1 Tax=Legionella micdadei TaxID=451 RepID=A0A098GIG7_LEGMI|nr:DotH/IcmK family type IV secretion protein [Legionella micdadei]ARG99557.1 type IV secretion protein IcmK [Legionella micdadei]KTD26500.1 IcmK protein [Legionella micdadei]NSL17910.1 type IV secretion protein IcmK [Legionella micdadei]CEG61782.1 Component of the Dot/Icm secretion system [Legionella micdadei]SCY23340.1 intracellular multiplication protein IcmK [Legionella micdadei]